MGTYIIPCVTFAQHGEKAGTCGFLTSLVCFFVPIVNLYIGAKTRSDTREKYELREVLSEIVAVPFYVRVVRWCRLKASWMVLRWVKRWNEFEKINKKDNQRYPNNIF